ncbi:hsp70-binding protein 1-like [Branchiostoma floridae]|uniref:Hsp70-binding protein 1 n=1 Tax=Branchiostoma floridae TaxID=7739 RepID=A0A9J7L142_BRAFL|nr:hsp70-binding protein 1-like [Branchiostoma floridae]
MADGGDPGSGGSDDRNVPRNPNLEGVLRYAIENTPENAGDTPVSPGPMDVNRRQWLGAALHQFAQTAQDDVEQMKTCLQTLAEGGEDHIEEKETAMEELMDLCCSIDNAQDLHKMGGLVLVISYLKHRNSGLRWRAGDVIATVTQNNPFCQAAALELAALPTLLELVDTDPDSNVRVKALYAISRLTGSCEEAQQRLVEHDGFSVLMRAMQSDTEKLKVKAAFLLRNLCLSNPQHKDTLCNMGMVTQLASMLQTEHNTFHEHLMGALVALVTGNRQAVKDCRQPQLRLKQVLTDRIEHLKGREEFQEEMEYCQQLLHICFSQHDDTLAAADR